MKWRPGALAMIATFGLIGACDSLNLTGDSDSKDGPEEASCAVSATPSIIEAGQGVTLSTTSPDLWDAFETLSINEHTLSKAVPSVVVKPSYSRTYSVQGTLKDGSIGACTISVTVKDTPVFGCTVAANPSQISEGETAPVTATLQVIGDAEVSATAIDDVDLGSVVGGSQTVSLSASRNIIGRVTAASGRTATCATAVIAKGNSLEPNQCTKVEIDDNDRKKLTVASQSLEAENQKHEAEVRAKALPGEGFVKIADTDLKAAGVTHFRGHLETADCESVATRAGLDHSGSCTLNRETGKSFWHLEVGGKHYTVYELSDHRQKFEFYTKDSEVQGILLTTSYTQTVKVPVSICGCDPSRLPGGRKAMADAAFASDAPQMNRIYIQELPGPLDPNDPGAKEWKIIKKSAGYDKTIVEPPPGAAKPVCPISTHAVT